MKNTRSGRFQDVTRASGLLLGRTPVGTNTAKNSRASQVVAFADVDNDGDLDAFSGTRPYDRGVQEAPQQAEILHNNGFGGFVLSSTSLPAAMRPGGATFLDGNRDGFIDLFVPSAQRRTVGTAIVNGWFFSGDNSPTTRFRTDQAEARGITFRAGDLVQSSAACDLNADGWPELLLGTVERQPNGLYAGTARSPAPARLPYGASPIRSSASSPTIRA